MNTLVCQAAQEAYRIELVNEVVPLKDLLSTAEKWANDILSGAPPLASVNGKGADQNKIWATPRKRLTSYQPWISILYR